MTEEGPISPSEEEPPVCDRAALARLRKWGGERLLDRMLSLFVADFPRRLSDARSGIRNGVPEETERAAHALASSCGQLGAARAQALCSELESRAASGDLAGVGSVVDSLEIEISRYVDAVGKGPAGT